MRVFKLQSLLVSALLCSTALPAYAANTLLLQLGNASSKEDAARTFGELQAKYPVLLGKYRMITRQVTNIDNETTWRVQAGKIENRGRANRICAELKDDGQECFIVETAAIKTDDMVEVPPVAAPSSSDASPSSSSSSSSSSFFSNPFGLRDEKAEAPVKEEPQIVEKAPKREEVKEEPETKQGSGVFYSKVVPNGPPPRVSAPKTVSYEIDEVLPWNWFDENGSKNARKEAPKPVRIEKAEKPKPVVVAEKAPEVERTPEPEKKGGGLFGWLSGDDDKDVPKPAPVEIAPPPVKETKAEAKTNINKQSAKDAAAAEEKKRAELIPPPPPEPVVKIEPVEVMPSASGKVEVAEAIPVPLSAGAGRQMAPTPILDTNINTNSDLPQNAAPADGISSDAVAPAQQRWIQISNFNNEQEATACSADIRTKVGDAAAGLRVQLVKNLWLGSRSRISLRAGPIPSDEVADAICQTAKTCNPAVECRGVGQATVTSPTPRYQQRKPVNASITSVFWAQLGSLPSRAAAAERFAMLQSAHRDALGKYEMMISEAQTSGTTATLYRLRVGPFITQDAAGKICAKLKSRGTSCIVVGE